MQAMLVGPAMVHNMPPTGLARPATAGAIDPLVERGPSSLRSAAAARDQTQFASQHCTRPC